ncbi:alpha/beta fold hydrolase [Nocardioides sp. T2.26MG-1]|uniref:alpha/beta fold hydrolase n=1 Tax=Nocardioides sp. T2.26MG-1 TaxID=3041166 RepID=UPI002477B8DC|nr:alpha/beta hydrolase [Nocardioides sp. T2.26MG-1]CAI9407697.1 putative protein [Nocardioides sp. T2.26MG-1]
MDARHEVPAALTWRRTTVDGRPATYGEAGSGPVVLFLHGWALSDRTYRRSLRRLSQHGYRVVAPALPGFGGTPPLPEDGFSLAGYADWVAAFAEAAEITGPVTVVGHSFGGAVALKTAHAHPGLVAQLVLVNSIGGSTWRQHGEKSRTMAERPIWDWGLHLTSHALSLRGLMRVVPVVVADALPNAIRHPASMWRVGGLAREANLVEELEDLKRRRLPVVILWGREDTVVPWACAESLIGSLHDPHVVTVPGDHSWLIGNPEHFAETLTNVLQQPVRRPRRSAG